MPSVIVAIVVLLVAGGFFIRFSAKHEVDHAVAVRKQATHRFADTIESTIVRDVDDVLKRSGMCGAGCATHNAATWNWKWQIAMGNGALLVDLTARPAVKDSPDLYSLTVYSLSAMPDGDLSVAHRIEPVLKELLGRFGYPGADRPFTSRQTESGNSRYTTRGPGPVQVLWRPFPGKEQMRGQWSFSVQRTGPFNDEPSSWRSERE